MNPIQRSVFLVATISIAAALGCATSREAASDVPRHPFPRWVSHLESGRTPIEEVLGVFGQPAEIEEPRAGTVIWRYAYAEIHWSPGDPRRPEVAADGTPIPEEPPFSARALDAAKKTGRFLDALLFYPPTQPERVRRERLPATVHRLEVAFDAEGTLTRFHYAPRDEYVGVRRR